MATKKKSVEKKETVVTKKNRVAAVAAQLNKRGANPSIYPASEASVPWWFLRRPTGLAQLDYHLNGGLPAGGSTQIIGRRGSGKTTLANYVIANNQKIYGRDSAVAIITVETPYNKQSAKFVAGVQVAFSKKEISLYEESLKRKLSADEKEILLSQVGEVYVDTKSSAEDIWDDIHGLAASREFQIIVVDSIGAFITNTVMKKETKDGATVASNAGINTIGMNKLSELYRQCHKDGYLETSLLFINQWRDQIGRFGGGLNVSGGHAMQHGHLIEIVLRSGANLYSTKERDKDSIPYGKNVRWEITKNKAGGPEGQFCTEEFIYTDDKWPKGFNKAKSLFTIATQLGIIQVAGAWYSTDFNDEALKVQGAETMTHAIWDNVELRKSLNAKILQLGRERMLSQITGEVDK